MVYSTHKNIVSQMPCFLEDTVCGKYCTYPNLTENRQSEGGLRLLNQYKKTRDNKPLITVITVVYNRKQVLGRCIKSVLTQDYDNVEYIIIDGASTDNTMKIVNKYKNAIDYFVSEPDKGIYDAMNKGLSLSTGESIIMLNSDDWFPHAQLLSIVAKSIATNPNAIVYGRLNMYRNTQRYTEMKKVTEKDFFEGRSMPHQASYIASSVYNIVGRYDISYTIAGDTEFFFRAKFHEIEFIYIDHVLANFSEGGASSQKIVSIEEHFFMFLRYNIWNLYHMVHKLKQEEIVSNPQEIQEVFKYFTLCKSNIDSLINYYYYYRKKKFITYTGILLTSDVHNRYNNAIINTLFFQEIHVQSNVTEFFQCKYYPVVIIENISVLLDDMWHPPNTLYAQKIEHIKKLFEFYVRFTKFVALVSVNNDFQKNDIQNTNDNIEETMHRDLAVLIYSYCNTIIFENDSCREKFETQFSNISVANLVCKKDDNNEICVNHSQQLAKIFDSSHRDLDTIVLYNRELANELYAEEEKKRYEFMEDKWYRFGLMTKKQKIVAFIKIVLSKFKKGD